jgi:hypothetical protein
MFKGLLKKKLKAGRKKKGDKNIFSDFYIILSTVVITVRKKIKLHINDKRKSFGGDIKRPYYLFIEMGEKQFVFSNKVKAKKWLVTFENKLNSLLGELILNVPKLYNHNIQLSLHMSLPQQTKLRGELDFVMERYWLLYNSNHLTSIGREINNIFFQINEQMEFYKKLLGKNSRNHSALTETKIALKHLKYLRNDIDQLFDVDKNLLLLSESKDKIEENINLSEMYLRIA